jgi:5-methylcytosine-specific restriction endonuclease McrA
VLAVALIVATWNAVFCRNMTIRLRSVQWRATDHFRRSKRSLIKPGRNRRPAMINLNVYISANPLCARLQRMLNEVPERFHDFRHGRCVIANERRVSLTEEI